MDKGVKLNKNHITEVIFRLEFSTINELNINDETAVDSFKNKISDIFPNYESIPNNKISLNINVDANQAENLVKQSNHLVWIFKNDKNDKFVTLSPNDLVLEYKAGAYVGFTKFLEEILLLLDAIKKYNPIELNFLGLRYINQIFDQQINRNIGDYINSDLLNNCLINNLKKNNEELIQIFTKVHAKKDNYLITFQYGVFNPEFPNENNFKPFILDYDCVTHDINSINDIKQNLIDMNHIIFKKFDYSITPEFINLMKGDINDSSN